MRKRLRKFSHTVKDVERADLDIQLYMDLWRSIKPEGSVGWDIDIEVQYNLFNPFTADVTFHATSVTRRRD